MATHITAGVYGTIAGQPPYVTSGSTPPWANFDVWATPAAISFPTAGTVFHPVSPGQQVGNTSNYIYSVIEVVQSGLQSQPRSTKYASNATVASLASSAS